MLEALVADSGRHNVSHIAELVGMPIATAHRQVTTFVAEGYLTPLGGGRHVAGARLLGLLHQLDERQIAAHVAAPILRGLAARVRSVVQLGTLSDDMVTYLIKTGRGASDLFTRVDMQLEAYCSGIGKVLLAHMPQADRAAYLAGGPFVALTEHTITDPVALKTELDRVRAQGFAIDQGEIVTGLRCVAVPLRNIDGTVLAAISVSQAEQGRHRIDDAALLHLLRGTASEIEHKAFGR